ncbi:hypothetical protein PCE31106_00147 [Pandoraea cepalis]|uniref:Ribbon-helix-helix protein CopG domain-containing protein n=1 Tax=Pandoraea cepalis TaxID=2508294 RepID=A0A5E4RF55_9BURK|nr:hypothetical protein [Pandoraea cepalis]VVD62046.1 hypothetical protein PCE31106_00147 [Pandoraea cepalis]
MAMPNLHVRLKPTSNNRLKDLAEAQGISQGDIARRAIDAYLDGIDIAAMLDEQRRAMNQQIAALDDRLSKRFEDHLKSMAMAFASIHLTVDQAGQVIGGRIDELPPDAARRAA